MSKLLIEIAIQVISGVLVYIICKWLESKL